MTDTEHTASLTARLAHFFSERPGAWIDGRQIAHIAGAYGWRTRISDARRAPHFLSIENRQRRMATEDGKKFTVSEYRYVPSTPPPNAGDHLFDLHARPL